MYQQNDSPDPKIEDKRMRGKFKVGWSEYKKGLQSPRQYHLRIGIKEMTKNISMLQPVHLRNNQRLHFRQSHSQWTHAV